MKWFQDVENISDLRKKYKDLVRTHHPDNGGDLSDIQSINAEYDSLFLKLKEQHDKSESSKNETDKQKQYYDWEKDKNIRDMILALSRFPVTIEMIGIWIWVSNCYEYRKELKELGLHWAKNKGMWYIHFDDYHKFGKKTMSMDNIRMKYGSVVVRAEKEKKSMIKG